MQTRFNSLISSLGVPVVPLDFFPNQVGKVMFVDSVYGGDDNSGERSAPLKTIQKAVDRSTSGNGDIIFVMPGTYEENVVIDQKDFVSIIGAGGSGYERPDVESSAGLALHISRSQGIKVARMRFVASSTHCVRVEGNGFMLSDCVFDGSGGATSAGLYFEGNSLSDDYTASEGIVENCLIRESQGYGIAFKPGAVPLNGVGSTHLVIRNCRFLDNTGVDFITLSTPTAAYALQDSVIDHCWFMSKNKATHIDIQTNHGSANTGNVFTGCYIFDDAVDTTAIKMAGTASGMIGCFSLDGVIDGDALD